MHILEKYIITEIIDNIYLPKSDVLLHTRNEYDKILVMKNDFTFVGLLGRIDNKFIIFDEDYNNNCIKCMVVDDLDYRYITEQLITKILTKYDIAYKKIDQQTFDKNFTIVAKITEELDKQLHVIDVNNMLLQLHFALPYNKHFSQEGFLLRDNLNYLKNHEYIDFVYDYDMLINYYTGMSFWYYNIFIDLDNFTKLFDILYSYAITLKKF